MAKYFITWEADESIWPTEPKEQGAIKSKLAQMVKQGMAEGRTKDWGIFIGGDKGYSVVEGDALDLYKNLQQFHPYINFTVHQVLTIDEIIEATKSMMG
ncbi:MAG: DUF3303 family protein [Chloroflexota bacterium]